MKREGLLAGNALAAIKNMGKAGNASQSILALTILAARQKIESV